MIVIDTKKLIHILEKTPTKHNIMLVGRHGIGKSEILTEYYENKGLRVIPLFLGQMSDPGDLIGLPSVEGDNTRPLRDFGPRCSGDRGGAAGLGGSARMHFIPPYWFPIDDKPIVLFLDELNRARPEILQAVMDLTLNRSLAGHVLPKGSRIIAAINEGEEYQLTTLDPALVSRFNIYEFRPTVQEWLLWAAEHEVDQRVINFIQADPTFLDGLPEQKMGEDTGLERYPDRRAWIRVSECLTEVTPSGAKKQVETLSEDDLDLIAGIIGASAASRFYAFVQGSQMLSGSDVLNDFASCEAKLRQYRLHQMAVVTESIFRQLEISYVPQANDLQNELFARYAHNLSAYYAFLHDTEQREAMAFMANLFQSGSYQNAILFITEKCPEIYSGMIEFIAEL